jgi:hypothetical protein
MQHKMCRRLEMSKIQHVLVYGDDVNWLSENINTKEKHRD